LGQCCEGREKKGSELIIEAGRRVTPTVVIQEDKSSPSNQKGGLGVRKARSLPQFSGISKEWGKRSAAIRDGWLKR